MKKMILVTGGAGFIGSNLVRALNKRGHDDIVIVDHLDHPCKQRNLENLKHSLYLDKSELPGRLKAGSLSSPAAVFHLGACSSTTETDENYLRNNNDLYTQNLCEWSLREGARFIYASSAATYGSGEQGYLDDEALIPLLRPLNPYGNSKQRFDLWALKTGTARRIAGLKYFNVYGPGEDHKGEMRSMINKAYAQVQNTGRLILFRSHRPDYRDGEQDRDFIHVDDAVDMTLFFLDHPEVSGIFNCGTGTARTWLDLAHAVFAAMNRAPNIAFTDIPESIRGAYQYHTKAEMGKIRKAGCQTTCMSLEEGVRRYIQEYLAKTNPQA